MKKIIAGVAKFQDSVFPRHKEHFARIAQRQEPFALFITCADSRVLPNLITQTDPGDLFICRDVGNIVPPYPSVYGGVSATIEYSVSVLKVRDVIVCGHSDCGAMRALLDPDSLSGLPHVLEWLRYSEDPHRTVMDRFSDLGPAAKLSRLIEANVMTQLDHLRTHPAVIAGLDSGALSVHGWVYDIESGAVRAYCPEEGVFRPVEPSPGESPRVELLAR
jgi:carbonic anhydrase